LLPVVYLVLRTLGAGMEAWDLLFRVRILQILGRTVLLVVAVSLGSIALAVPLAWLTVRTDLPLRKVWAVLTALPLVIPSYVGGLVVVVALGPRGMLQGLLDGPFGIERLPDIHGFSGAFLTITFLSYPYALLTVRAALQRMDPSLEETSRSLGFSPWSTFLRVTLLHLRPAVAAGALLVGLYTLSDFGAVSLLRYETFTWAIFVQYESALDRTLGAALSLVLVGIALGIVAAESLTRGRSRYYSSGSGAARPPAPARLGRWRWPAVAFCATVVIVSLALPVSILGYWVIRGVAAGEPFLVLWEALRNSMYVSALAALAAVAASLPIAILSVRYPGLLSTIFERVTYIGFALPGIAVALALVFFGAKYTPPLYQTTGLLVFAYVVLFLSPAVGAARTSLLQVSPHMEEAARGLGRSPLRVFASVTLPLVRPGIISGGALVFLLTMKELPATLILSPVGFTTLATSIWAATSEAFFAQAAAPALLLILASSIPLAFLMLRDRR
tara:strand:+ start:573 stop:2078 length:1506 start_codon:yes stop_codon:yes gene_type:complete